MDSIPKYIKENKVLLEGLLKRKHQMIIRYLCDTYVNVVDTMEVTKHYSRVISGICNEERRKNGCPYCQRFMNFLRLMLNNEQNMKSYNKILATSLIKDTYLF